MKLSQLAKMAADLPTLDFNWPGPEQWHADNFDRNVADFDAMKEYVDALRHRIGEQSVALSKICEAFNQLRDAVLEARIEDTRL